MRLRFSKNIQPETVIVDSDKWDKKTGKPEPVALPIQVIDNVFANDRKLTVRLVEELSYEYDRQAFDNICQQFGLNDEEKDKLKAIVFLNSGYVNRRLLQEHAVYERMYEFGEVDSHYGKLVESLYSAKQAAPPPKGRKLYHLASYKKQPGLFSKSDVKDIMFLLLLSVGAVVILANVLPLIPSGNKDIDIYVRDGNGNYVLDENGKAITKREQCYKDRDLGAAIGYGNTNGHCTHDGKWVDGDR